MSTRRAVRPGPDPQVLDWLLQGDPSIRWQVMADLLEAPASAVARERKRVATEGWGARLLAHQDADGRFGGRLYGNKWLSTTDSLLLLRQLGLEPGHERALLGCQQLLEGGFGPGGALAYARSGQPDLGVAGMVLSALAWFGLPDPRLHAVVRWLLAQQRPDGRFEPVPDNDQLRYAFAATLLVLEGLRAYAARHPRRAAPVRAAMARGRGFLLAHELFSKAGGGAVLHPDLLRFAFPPRWHYDVLAALDHFQACRAGRDRRLEGAIMLVRRQGGRDGRWRLQHRHPGRTFFELEQPGAPSRWNTLRALRVLRWWDLR